MDPIYVTGHRNPDTDSIVSAMAYAALRNALGDGEFVPVRLGGVSDETQFILDRFGFEPPMWLRNIRTQVRDLSFDTPPVLNDAVTIIHAWTLLQDDTKVPALPIADENGKLVGMLTPGDIAAYNMHSLHDPSVDSLPVFNLISALEGRIVNEDADLPDSISGEIVIALPLPHGSLSGITENSVVICGQQPDVIEEAISRKAACIILCQCELDEAWHKVENGTCIISTPFDAYRAARMIHQSIPISRICHKENIACFHLSDFIDDVREEVLKSRFRSYPILDENDRVVGTLSRYHLIRPRRKRLVLVDHNETAQSLPGLEQAEILEIIDHHRLADVQTVNPIYFRNEPVGSTATIISGMFQERGLMPTPPMAGLLASAIVSDTVMFRSPTATLRDRRMAERMARIAGVDLDELGRDIFSATALETKPASELLFSDFKEFHIAGHDIGIGQITCMDAERVLSLKDQFIEIMEITAKERGYDMMLLMLTDMLREGTELLVVGDENNIIGQAFNAEVKKHCVFLPGIVSRKKQIVPTLSALWG